MSHRVLALYSTREKAQLAMGDLQSMGVEASGVRLAEGLSEGSGRLEVRVRDLDQAVDVKAFLDQDGATSTEIREGADDVLPHDTIPHVPAG